MPLPRGVVWILPVAAIVSGVAPAAGQNYPGKPIRIVTAEPGGGTDFAARLIAQALTGPLGQQVIVDNRGVLSAEFVAKAPPDGYTLLLYPNTIWTLPLIQTAPYDPVKDFSPITLAVTSPNVLVVHPSIPVVSVRELIALAKTRPGSLNYASGPAGSIPHLAGELFKTMAGVNIVRINYKGAGPGLNDLIGGQVQLMFAPSSSAAPHVRSGRLRALAITSAQPSALAPDLPTVAASGLPGYEAATIYGVFAPARTPETRINRLNQEIVRVLGWADVKEKFFSSGMEPAGTSPEQFAAVIKAEMATMGKVIKDAGIHAE